MNYEVREKLKEFLNELNMIVKKGEKLIVEFENDAVGYDYPVNEDYENASEAIQETIARIDISFLEEVIDDDANINE